LLFSEDVERKKLLPQKGTVQHFRPETEPEPSARFTTGTYPLITTRRILLHLPSKHKIQAHRAFTMSKLDFDRPLTWTAGRCQWTRQTLKPRTESTRSRTRPGGTGSFLPCLVPFTTSFTFRPILDERSQPTTTDPWPFRMRPLKFEPPLIVVDS
jgi:hypothetical protein